MVLRRLLGLAVGAAMVVSAWAHGYLVEPVARNVGASDCPHCLDGGGVGGVYAGGLRWPNGNFGVCGDPVKGEKAGYHMGGGEFERKVGIRITKYRVGATISASVTITANHWGYFEYFLCKLPDSSSGGKDEARYLTNACFAKNQLQVQQDGAWGTRFYIAARTGSIDMKVRLPAWECKRCVMRWLYTTGNSCTAPNTPKKWAVSSNLQTCGQDGANPELFLNCADVALLKDGPTQPQTSKLAPAQGAAVAEEDEEDEEQEAPVQPADAATTTVNATTTTTTTTSTSSSRPPIPLQPAEIAISFVAGGVLGAPLLLVSPVLGAAAGIFVCVGLLLLFVLRNLAEK